VLAVSPDDIKELRRSLRCTAKELAAALGLEQAEVLAWEKGDLFPTKKHVLAMGALREKGPDAIVHKRRGKPAPARGPMAALRDPDLWALVRKLAAHPTLFDEARKLADGYEDPADDATADQTGD
jgi:transcriptional regulator with XRE-family HTH domain